MPQLVIPGANSRYYAPGDPNSPDLGELSRLFAPLYQDTESTLLPPERTAQPTMPAAVSEPSADELIAQAKGTLARSEPLSRMLEDAAAPANRQYFTSTSPDEGYQIYHPSADTSPAMARFKGAIGGLGEGIEDLVAGRSRAGNIGLGALAAAGGIGAGRAVAPSIVPAAKWAAQKAMTPTGGAIIGGAYGGYTGGPSGAVTGALEGGLAGGIAGAGLGRLSRILRGLGLAGEATTGAGTVAAETGAAARAAGVAEKAREAASVASPRKVLSTLQDPYALEDTLQEMVAKGATEAQAAQRLGLSTEPYMAERAGASAAHTVAPQTETQLTQDLLGSKADLESVLERLAKQNGWLRFP